ncbi:3TM-type holin [Mailhella sp.]
MSWAALIPAVTSLLGEAAELWQGDKKRQAELVLEQIRNSQAQLMGQLEINKQEAAHSSVFVAGWRPFIGWCCGLGVLYSFFLRPMLTWGLLVIDAGLPALPELDGEELAAMISGLLGLGGLRTFEKAKGVAR